jgi:glyoxylase-like metal-dependent hydrolase (beta-lactamase superfamily II)
MEKSMQTKRWLIAIAIAALPMSAVRAQDSRPTLQAASAALGADTIDSLRIAGRGSDFAFGQAYDGDSAWPRFNLTRYILAIDYKTPSLQEERTRTQAQNPPLGGANQPIEEQRQTSLLSGNYAWNSNGEGGAAPAGPERDFRPALESRQTQIWLTPQGFLKEAIACNATVATGTVRGKSRTTISFTAPNGVKLEGVLNDQNLVDQITTWLESPVLGDTKLEAIFEDYRDFNRVKFPVHIIQREGGYPVLDLTVTDVKSNAVSPFVVPDKIKSFQAPATESIAPVKLSDGVWSFPSNSYQAPKSFAVEFKDYIAVVEAPDTEARSIAVIDSIKKTIPNKPIKYLINTHTHFDHSGGVRTYVAEGATILTYWQNIPYFEQVWSNPWTIHPDRLAKSGKKPQFEGVVGSRVLTDGARELDIYHYAGNFHNPGMLAIYLPKERILIEADSFNPPPDPANSPTAIPNLVQFYGVVQQLGLDVEQIVPIHGRPVTLDDARKDIEAYGAGQLWQPLAPQQAK